MSALRWLRLRGRLRRITLLVLDVDGVLTDGGLWFDADGRLTKRFDVRDGLGIRLLQQAGLEIAFLSGGQGGATESRARQLGIRHCLVGIRDKPAFVGDDLNDLAVRAQVGLLLAPSDACRPVRWQADAVLNRPGGKGAIRELAERVLQARGGWGTLASSGWRDRND